MSETPEAETPGTKAWAQKQASESLRFLNMMSNEENRLTYFTSCIQLAFFQGEFKAVQDARRLFERKLGT